jgi:hypothetical protein
VQRKQDVIGPERLDPVRDNGHHTAPKGISADVASDRAHLAEHDVKRRRLRAEIDRRRQLATRAAQVRDDLPRVRSIRSGAGQHPRPGEPGSGVGLAIGEAAALTHGGRATAPPRRWWRRGLDRALGA